MVGKTAVVVYNHDCEAVTSQSGCPSAANPELGSGRQAWAYISVFVFDPEASCSSSAQD
jgi:hypothetical protein